MTEKPLNDFLLKSGHTENLNEHSHLYVIFFLFFRFNKSTAKRVIGHFLL